MASMTASRTSVVTSTRKASMAPVARPMVHAFTAQRPVASASRAAETRRAAGIVARAAPVAEPVAAQKSTGKKEWIALVCNAEWFFMDPNNESVAEQLRERVRFFKEQNIEQLDFHIVENPAWLDQAQFQEVNSKVKRPSVALIGTDAMWITFMKLRLDRVLKVELKGMSDKDALASAGPIPDFKPSGKWTAPYARYTPGWWKVFAPKL
ncbi:hypothetical protein HYH03_017149 [Edaphochlamys debaryana]|uniref:Uncharacterized protein n=1 Tax=Edaphochlamys debaryana TaxID=47281 RepID=A0A835XIW6_9CHLO|nr:hypothetical protein HYH03_017149 [Edaphochlamys debaryana]|eukprot:KAG2483982.1 hypothetical protein HYH03_017149 [Edaphochlamys debaryana]